VALQTRRDQAQAYAFVNRRLSSALIAAEPDAAEQPMRRLGRSGIAGLMVAALAIAAVTVIGYLLPGNADAWRAAGVLVVEKETSTRYLFADGVLHPVLNFTSARLALGSANPTVRAVSARSLSGVPRGLPIGIPGAPDDLPPGRSLVTGPWDACSQPTRDPSGTLRATTVLSGGPTTPGTRLPADGAALVAAPDGTQYLLWHDTRLRLAGPRVRAALGYDAVAALPVGAAVLSTIPEGPPLQPIQVAGTGQPGPQIGGVTGVLGRVYLTDAGDYYVLTAAGPRPVTPLQAQIQLTAPDYPASLPAPQRIPTGTAVTGSTVDGGLPASAPHPQQLGPESDAVCATYASGAVTVSTRPAQVGSGPATEPVDPTGGPLADRVTLPPGTAALVSAQPGPGLAAGTGYLVTDLGVKYPLGESGTAATLGYSGVTPVPLPAPFVQLLRTGPRLDRADAVRTIPLAGP
jgi:type VII secretion protein EccB